MGKSNTPSESTPKHNLPTPRPSFILQTVDGSELQLNLADVANKDEPVCAPLVDLPPPPDGGWGWVICFASFMCNLILDGLAYSFGVLLPPLVKDFDSNRGTVSWVGSLLCGVYLMSGPIVGGLVNKFGCRFVCILGSVVACIGIGLSTLSPNVPVLMLTYGVIGGFGLGLIYLPAVVAVGYYFESKRALATGISVCGSGVGTFVFAPLATQLLSVYGWKGANLIFAGLCLNCAAFGALMRPLELKAKIIEPEKEETAIPEEDEFEEDDEGMQFSSDALLDSKREALDPLPEEKPAMLQNIPALPTITEQSVTAVPKKEDKPKITDIFPDQEVSSGTSNETSNNSVKRKSSGRIRTISNSEDGKPSRFQMTPIKKKLGPIPRNTSAPHFIDAKSIIPRNTSTPGLERQTSHPSHPKFGANITREDSHVIFGIEVGSNLQLSNTQLYLAPSSSSINRRGSRRSSKPLVRPFSRKDIFYGGSVSHLVDVNEMPPNNDQYRHSIISTPRRLSSIPRGSIVASHLSLPAIDRKASSVIPDELLDSEDSKPIWDTLKEMINFTLLSNPIFMLVGLSNIFGMIGFYVPFVYLPNMAVLKGIALEDANFLISIIGISNTIGRVLSGWFSDFSWVDSLLVTNIAILLSGITTFVLPFCTSYAAFTCMALAFGFFVATYISLTSIVLVDLLGLDNLTSAFGLLVLFRGVTSIMGPPLAGAVFDATQSYDISFYMAGGALILSSLVSFGAQMVQRTRQRAAENKSSPKKTNGAI